MALLYWWSRSPGLSAESSVEDNPTPQGPKAKKPRSGQTPDHRDLSCLKVKGKHGQEGLFVDLGKSTITIQYDLQ